MAPRARRARGPGVAMSPPPLNLNTLWVSSGPPPNLPPHGGEKEAGVRAPAAGDVPESPLPGPSQPKEAGGAGLVTHFSFRFCQESSGNLLKSLQRKPGRWASRAGSPRPPPPRSTLQQRGPRPRRAGDANPQDARRGPSRCFHPVGAGGVGAAASRWPRDSQAPQGCRLHATTRTRNDLRGPSRRPHR